MKKLHRTIAAFLFLAACFAYIYYKIAFLKEHVSTLEPIVLGVILGIIISIPVKD